MYYSYDQFVNLCWCVLNEEGREDSAWFFSYQKASDANISRILIFEDNYRPTLCHDLSLNRHALSFDALYYIRQQC